MICPFSAIIAISSSFLSSDFHFFIFIFAAADIDYFQTILSLLSPLMAFD